MGPRGLKVLKNAYFSLLKHTKKLSLVTFHDTTAEIEVSFRTHRRRNMEDKTRIERQTDVTVEIVI